MRLPDMDSSLVKALLYGPPGSGKTRLGASATFVQDMYPVLMLESAGNPVSIRKYDPLPTILTMDSMKDYNAPYDFLSKGQPDDHPFKKMLLDAGVELPKEKFRTVFVDGMTEVQRFAFRVVIPGRDSAVGDLPASTEIQHFNSVLSMMTNWAYKFIKLDMHVILSSLEAEKQDKSGGIFRRPLLWGQSQGEISSYVYMVMRLSQTENMDARTKAVVANEIDEIKRSTSVGFVRASSSFYAKEQYGMRDEDGEMKYMFNPTMEKIWMNINS